MRNFVPEVECSTVNSHLVKTVLCRRMLSDLGVAGLGGMYCLVAT